MSRFDSMVSSEAWERLVSEYKQLLEEGAESDYAVAELLRDTIYEVEGI